MKKKWKVAFGTIISASLAGLFWQVEAPAAENFASEDQLVFSDIAWLLTASCLVLLMTPGLSLFYGGMVGKKNLISTMLQSFISLGVVTMVWTVVGFSLAFGDPIGIEIDGQLYGLIGNPFQYMFFDQVGKLPHLTIASSIPFVLFALFQMKFAVITPAIITGSFAERVRFIGYVFFIGLFCVLVYAPLCHMVWHPDGLIGAYFGVLDFAGGTVVHISAGFASLAGAMFIGKRRNQHHAPSNITYIMLGTGMLWFGWFGFNAGSSLAANGTAAVAFATTTISSATAMMTWVFFDRIQGRKITAMGACIGAVVGLVVITPAAGFITVPQSMFFGFIGAIVSNLALSAKSLKKMDDTLDVFACHGVGGIMGMILTAIFASPEGSSLLHGGWAIFGSHMVVLVGVSVFSFVVSYAIFFVLNKFVTLRVRDEYEEVGLDISQHGESA
ncbi:ammonia channel protein [Echinicola strongylocentroti]|uniref:Ammonium transporter n=1 Tax=Echinicola strongylocentroti TaxID=1795355 RepID=A0A2Z4ID52_9BACT|nr:ammonium transporter [Echinicola strongylocentroti]AWW28705.1 ammonia channel protein [Echinicola strongylocentroti]